MQAHLVWYFWVSVWWGLGSQDSRLPAEFEITKFCHHVGKENVIAVQVMRWSDGSYLEDQDHWWLSGIHRNVIIFSKPQVGSPPRWLSTNMWFFVRHKSYGFGKRMWFFVGHKSYSFGKSMWFFLRHTSYGFGKRLLEWWRSKSSLTMWKSNGRCNLGNTQCPNGLKRNNPSGMVNDNSIWRKKKFKSWVMAE